MFTIGPRPVWTKLNNIHKHDLWHSKEIKDDIWIAWEGGGCHIGELPGQAYSCLQVCVCSFQCINMSIFLLEIYMLTISTLTSEITTKS